MDNPTHMDSKEATDMIKVLETLTISNQAIRMINKRQHRVVTERDRTMDQVSHRRSG